MVDERYIVVGWGRDYADVPPLRGIIYTDSESSVIDVSVDVAPFQKGDAACVTLCPDLPGKHLTFENSVCLSCGRPVVFVARHGDAGDRLGARHSARRRGGLPGSTGCARICIWPNAIGW